MRSLVRRLLRRLLKDERGQSVVVPLVMISATMGLAGMAIETGHIYYAFRLLQASTNAAALAAGFDMPNIGASTDPSAGTAYYNLYQYSVESGELNATKMLTNATISANFYCSSTTESSLNVGCMIPTSGSCSNSASACNAVTATQQATIPLWFGGLIGYKTVTVTAEATAAMRGGISSPWNIAIIMDTTRSMTDSDSGDQCDSTQIVCALQGLTVLLEDLFPCAGGQTCTATGATAVDSVSLFAFPALEDTAANIDKDTVCQTSDPTTVSYTIPDTTPAYTPGTAPASNLMLPTGSSGDTYQVVNFDTTYKTVDSNSTLNASDALAIAAGDSGVSGCQGLQAPGGKGTYYAQVIYAAQAALATQQANNPGSKNAIILLSDGDATACAEEANTTYGACDSASDITATEGTLNGTCTSSQSCTNTNATSVVYPSALGECGQAVLAAQYAANEGTQVYIIGYGSETEGGNASSNAACISDRTYSASVTTNGGTWAAGDSPCQAMQAMASDPANFYSDDGQGCKASDPNSSALTKLTSIFHAITDTMTVARLVPNGTS
jgi:hypothetical protein